MTTVRPRIFGVESIYNDKITVRNNVLSSQDYYEVDDDGDDDEQASDKRIYEKFFETIRSL